MPNDDVVIDLGSEPRLVNLFTFPNRPSDPDDLAATILHWFRRTLVRDGFLDVAADVFPGARYRLRLSGPPNSIRPYETLVPRLLAIGDGALVEVQKLKDAGEWRDDRGWRFFLPLGLPMVNQRCLQFFHYPPIRLLNYYRDYLDDPVPVRVEELLLANRSWGDLEAYQTMSRDERDRKSDVVRYETVVDAAPIAAPDEDGTMGIIPIQSFPDYQKAMVKLLCHPHWNDSKFTIPIMVYGREPRLQFNRIFGTSLEVMKPADVIIDTEGGRTTRVLAINHPYAFYATAQSDAIGGGKLVPKACAGAATMMFNDLVAASWQISMSESPARDPVNELEKARAFWRGTGQPRRVCTLVQHEGSYLASGPDKLKYEFLTSLAAGDAFCAAHQENPCWQPTE